MWVKNSPASILWRTAPGHLLYTLAAAAHFARAGLFVPFLRAKVAALRPPNRPPGIGSDEIDDPVGMGLDVYRATAERLDRLCAELAALVLPDGAHGEVVDIDPLDDDPV